MRYIAKPIPVSDYPFRVAEPNSIGLPDWQLNTSTGRKAMANTLATYPEKSKLTSSSWIAPGPPVNGSFESLVDSTMSTESEYSFEFKVTGSIKVPKIFQVNAAASYDISYSNEVKTTSSIGHDIELEINLSPEDAGYINNSHTLYLDLYLFSYQDSIKYWYWDSLPAPQQKPWYIAYIASSASKSISLLEPVGQGEMDAKRSLFTWKGEGLEEPSYTLVIGTSWPLSPANVVYSESTGDKTAASPVGLSLEPGKTYYWAVRGTDASGEIRWSDPRSFTTPTPSTQETDEIP
jgi:hypothetical protein